jgi:hypothetical protein
MSSARSPSVSTRFFDVVERFLQIEAASGIALLSAAPLLRRISPRTLTETSVYR